MTDVARRAVTPQFVERKPRADRDVSYVLPRIDSRWNLTFEGSVAFQEIVRVTHLKYKYRSGWTVWVIYPDGNVEHLPIARFWDGVVSRAQSDLAGVFR